LAAHASGGRRLSPPPQFTRRAEVRERFADIAAEVVGGIEAACVPLQEKELIALIHKLAAHCQRAGWQDAGSIEELAHAAPAIIDAVIGKPRMLTERVNIGGMLKGHLARTSQLAASSAKSISAHGKPPAVLLQLGGGCRLVELATPAQLEAESRALGHCLGTMLNRRALAANGLKPGDAGASRYLHYAIRIRAGACRIFSLRNRLARPLATIEYDVRSEAIRQIEGSGGDLCASRPRFLPALCEALHRLSRELPVSDMPYLGQHLACYRRSEHYGIVLTRGGREAKASEVDPGDILTGKVDVDEHTPQPLLDRWAGVPSLTIDISRLSDCSRLPARVRGTLASSERAIGIPHLESAGRLHFASAECVHLPRLRSFKEMWAPLLRRFSAGRLETAGRVYARWARSFALPARTEVKEPSVPGGYQHGFRAAAESAELERRRRSRRAGCCPCGAGRWQDCALGPA
jgi:hypothetical protein